MSKKIIGIAAAVFAGICAAESLLALRKALQEKAAAEAAAADAAAEAETAETDASEPEAETGEAEKSAPVEG